MRSGPAATVGVLLGLALVLPACGDEGTAAAGGQSPTIASKAAGSGAKKGGREARAGTRPVAKRCGHLLGEFLDSMESLGNTLAVGLDYESYLGAVDDVRATYASVEADRLPIACLARVAGPAESALNVYIDAANTWGDCLSTASCDAEAIEPKLQREWERAADLLSSAQAGLRHLS
jgi:hypothetical protein